MTDIADDGGFGSRSLRDSHTMLLSRVLPTRRLTIHVPRRIIPPFFGFAVP